MISPGTPRLEFPRFDFKRLIREVNILLISDLHYDLDKLPSSSRPTATDINQHLIDSLEKLDPDWTPDILIVAGDLVNQGKELGYTHYFDLIGRITAKYPHLKDAVFSTPGNHDINRENIVSAFKYLYGFKLGKPPEKNRNSFTSNEIVNSIYTVSQYDLSSNDKKELLEHLKDFEKEYFKTYLKKEEEIHDGARLNKIAKDYPIDNLKTVYIKNILGITIVSLNSSFFCNFSNALNDRNNLFYIKEVIDRTIAKLGKPISPIITFMHHPFYYMHESEYIYPIDDTGDYLSNNFNKIADKSNLILSGHVHGELHEPSVIHQKTHSITNGTTFTDDPWGSKCYPYTFALIKINKQLNKFKLKSFRYEFKDKLFKQHTKQKDIYYRFQPKPFSSPNSPEMEKINLIDYISELAQNTYDFKSDELEILVIFEQLKVYCKEFDASGGQGTVKTIQFENVITVNYLFYQNQFRSLYNTRNVIVIKIDSAKLSERLDAFLKICKTFADFKNSMIFFAFKIKSILPKEKGFLKQDPTILTAALKSYILCSKCDFCQLEFIYY